MEKCIFSALWIESMNVFDLASSYKKTPQSVLSTIKEIQKLYINYVCFIVLVKKEKNHSTGLFVFALELAGGEQVSANAERSWRAHVFQGPEMPNECGWPFFPSHWVSLILQECIKKSKKILFSQCCMRCFVPLEFENWYRRWLLRRTEETTQVPVTQAGNSLLSCVSVRVRRGEDPNPSHSGFQRTQGGRAATQKRDIRGAARAGARLVPG